jgi:hypothetical protein
VSIFWSIDAASTHSRISSTDDLETLLTLGSAKSKGTSVPETKAVSRKNPTKNKPRHKKPRRTLKVGIVHLQAGVGVAQAVADVQKSVQQAEGEGVVLVRSSLAGRQET